jgi:hypothetical protein
MFLKKNREIFPKEGGKNHPARRRIPEDLKL